MRVTRVSLLSGKTHTMELDVTPEQMAELEAPNRRLIMEIFPHLTDGEREFLLTGITEAEWAAAFPPEESISAATDAWKDISSAPKDGTRVLLWAKEWVDPCTGQHYGEPRGWGVFYDVGMFKYQPTHWMPLPKPPHA